MDGVTGMAGKRLPKIIISAMLCCFAAVSQAQVYYGNGYTIIEGHDPQVGNDLNVRVFKTINAETVHAGLSQLLAGSGWQLAQLSNADPNILRLYQQPYPDFKRTLNPMTLGAALQYIAGNAWDLVVDPVNKLISFQLAARYRCQSVQGGTPCVI